MIERKVYGDKLIGLASGVYVYMYKPPPNFQSGCVLNFSRLTLGPVQPGEGGTRPQLHSHSSPVNCDVLLEITEKLLEGWLECLLLTADSKTQDKNLL